MVDETERVSVIVMVDVLIEEAHLSIMNVIQHDVIVHHKGHGIR